MRPIRAERRNLLTEGSVHFPGTIHTYDGAFTLTEIETEATAPNGISASVQYELLHAIQYESHFCRCRSLLVWLLPKYLLRIK